MVWSQPHGSVETIDAGVRGLTLADLDVAFQPIVDVQTGQTFAHEALARPKAPAYPNPGVLFKAAEREIACGRLGRLIREVAFAKCGPVPLFVNLHPQELVARWLVRADDPINFHNHPVYLEVTESATLEHFAICRDVIAELSGRSGAALVIDDFGAGYSNLDRVADLEPSVIKLDLALTRGIHEIKRRQIVVRHVVDMCKELGARVVAEGVETIEELVCVRDLGVDFAQGYLLARPASPPTAPIWPPEVPRKEAAPRRRGPARLSQAPRKSARPNASERAAACSNPSARPPRSVPTRL
jgi:EAL domain-containing protein (putative c-di-GMP-specific phosphodiesterase class I)